MHVKAKTIATAGLLVAFTVVMIVLSSVIETNTLFLIAAASFCVGIAIREWGLLFGLVFLVASILANLIVAPNKLYCLTYAGMGLYVLLYEWMWKTIADRKAMPHRNVWLWFGKMLLFNIFYVPTLFLAPKLLFVGKINGLISIFLLLVGQVAFLVYDMAYRYFQARIWGRFRGRLFQLRNF